MPPDSAPARRLPDSPVATPYPISPTGRSRRPQPLPSGRVRINAECRARCRAPGRGRSVPRALVTAAPKAWNSGRDTGSFAAFHSGCHCTAMANPGAASMTIASGVSSGA